MSVNKTGAFKKQEYKAAKYAQTGIQTLITSTLNSLLQLVFYSTIFKKDYLNLTNTLYPILAI